MLSFCDNPFHLSVKPFFQCRNDTIPCRHSCHTHRYRCSVAESGGGESRKGTDEQKRRNTEQKCGGRQLRASGGGDLYGIPLAEDPGIAIARYCKQAVGS